MFRRIGLVTVFAAAGILLAGCERKADDSPANDAAPVVTAANDVTPVDANAANSVATAGQGSATGKDCGGITGLSCSSDKEYCKKPDGQCNVPDAMGTCTVRPEICTEQYDPVCGCDGKTYGNACSAAAAGVSVEAAGECPKPKA